MRYDSTGKYIVMERGQHASDGQRRLEVVDAATGALVETHPSGYNPRWVDGSRIIAEAPFGHDDVSLGLWRVDYVPANRGQLDANGHGVWAVSDLRVTTVHPSGAVVGREPRLSASGELAVRDETGTLRIFGRDTLGPCEDARWSSETLTWWLGGRVWGVTTPGQPVTELTVQGRSCSKALPYWDGETLWVALVVDAGELWLCEWGSLARREALGWRIGVSDGAGFDYDLRSNAPWGVKVAYFDPLGVPVYAVVDTLQPPESMLKPAPVDPWELAEPGTLVENAWPYLFGNAPSMSADLERICLHKNVDQAEWREVPADGWVYHLFDRSRGEDVPTGPRQGWYLTPRECCRWCALSFRSGDTFSVNGEKVEWDTGARVRWTHRITMFALKHGGVMIRFDPRFPNQDYGPEKLYEDHYNSPTAGVRWIARYAPESDKGKPWAYRDTDVVAADHSSPITPGGPTPPYLECPRLSADDDPWAQPKPEEPGDMTTAEAKARAQFVAPYDIVEGARTQFKAHVLPRDVQDGRLSDGAERYFGQYYYPTMAGQQVETGVPGTADGWGHYSVQALNAAKAGYDKDQRPGEQPPPVTPGTLRGPISVANRDFTVPEA